MAIKNGVVADADEVNKAVGNTTAQLAYEQVKSDSTNWTNTDYLGADIFTDSNGAKNTIDTSSSTSAYDSNGFYDSNVLIVNSSVSTYDPDSVTNPENFFDGSTGTAATDTGNSGVTSSLGKTFSSRAIGKIRIVASTSTSGNLAGATARIEIWKYDGSSWSLHEEIASAGPMGLGNSATINYDQEYAFYETTQGIAIKMSANGVASGTASGDISFKMFKAYEITDSTVETNSILSDVVPNSIFIYGKTTLPTNTSITVDISDDGGTTFSLTGKSLNTAIDTSSFSTGNLALKFNLATTDTTVTPKLYGYGVSILES